MCNYRCPLAERRKCAGFLLCRAMEKEGKDYNSRQNALDVICLHQKQCMVTGMMENTDEARECHSGHIAAEAQPEPSESDVTDSPVVKTKKKAKSN